MLVFTCFFLKDNIIQYKLIILNILFQNIHSINLKRAHLFIELSFFIY